VAVIVYDANKKEVEERNDLIVCSQRHNAVLRVVRGPATTFLMPFWEKVGMVINTTSQKMEVRIENVLQHSGQPQCTFTVCGSGTHGTTRAKADSAGQESAQSERPGDIIWERTTTACGA